MPGRSEFVDHVVETMRQFGPVEAKSMFGGWGLYHAGAFFALVIDDVLYLKSDDENRADFDALGLGPCVYPMKDGRTIVMAYRQAPAEALEDAAVMAEWARKGYAAALRAAAVRRPRRPRGQAPSGTKRRPTKASPRAAAPRARARLRPRR